MLVTLGLCIATPAWGADVIWDFEEGNDHGFTLWSVSPAAPAADDPDTAGDEGLTGLALPGSGIAWTIGPPNQFEGEAPTVVEGCHVVNGVLEYGPCNDPFGAGGGDYTNGRGQQSYLNTYNLSQWGDALHSASNDQIATSPQVLLQEGAVLTVWAFGGSNARHAPELDPNPAEGYTNDSCGIAVLSATSGSMLGSVFTPASGGSGNMPNEYTLDLSAFAGQKVIIEGVDAFQGSWGWVAFDEIRITNAIDLGAVPPDQARDPLPGDGATDVPGSTVLNWTPGGYAPLTDGHRVFLSDVFADVNDGVASADRGITSDPEFDTTTLPFVLEFGQTYHWRVDEANSLTGWDQGGVWSFTVEPLSIPIVDITATASSSQGANMGPERTIDGSGLNEADQHSINGMDMWLSQTGDASVWIQYEFDKAYKLHEMWVWNSNQLVEPFVGLGAKDVSIEYSVDGVDWMQLENVPPFAQASGSADYAANTTIDLAGAVARYVKLNISGGWGFIPQYSLSEVRFFYIPTYVREPMPTPGAVTDGANVMLAWRAGREAVSHEIYLGTDPADLALAGTTTDRSYGTGALDFGTAYYWSVTEVNEAEAVSSYPGELWDFTTPDFATVDDFDKYDDDCERIFFAWEDGLGHNGGEGVDDCAVAPSNGNGGGSIVGNAQAPFAERTIVHSGTQSMPLEYDNAFGPSEATLSLDGQDWTGSGIRTLSLAFHGTAGNTGELYIKINNTKVVYDGDMSDITVAQWLVWNIDLTALSGLQNVTKLTIGVDGPNAAGVLYIDSIRLYPLPSELVTPVEPGPANLVALYAFNGNANDSSDNGYHGTENGGPTYALGVDGQALSLDGIDDYVTVDSVGITGAAPRTIAAWAKASTDLTSAWTNVFGFTGPSGGGGHFDIEIVGSTGTTTAGYFGIHRYQWEMDIMPNDLEWHHLAASFDGTTVRWHGDGRLVGSDDVDNVNTPGLVHMGKRDDNDNHFPGLVDDVRIYDIALSSDEIAWLAGKRTPMHKPF